MVLYCCLSFLLAYLSVYDCLAQIVLLLVSLSCSLVPAFSGWIGKIVVSIHLVIVKSRPEASIILKLNNSTRFLV